MLCPARRGSGPAPLHISSVARPVPPSLPTPTHPPADITPQRRSGCRRSPQPEARSPQPSPAHEARSLEQLRSSRLLRNPKLLSSPKPTSQLRPKIPHDAPTLSLLPAASSCALWPPAAPQPECKPLGLQPSWHQPGTAPKTSSTLPRPPRPISPSPACPATPSVMPLIPELCVEIPPYVVIMQGSCHSVVNLIAPHRCKTLPYIDVCPSK